MTELKEILERNRQWERKRIIEEYNEYINTPYKAGAVPWNEMEMMYTGGEVDDFEIDLPDREVVDDFNGNPLTVL